MRYQENAKAKVLSGNELAKQGVRYVISSFIASLVLFGCLICISIYSGHLHGVVVPALLIAPISWLGMLLAYIDIRRAMNESNRGSQL